jgi:hypothetical protein
MAYLPTNTGVSPYQQYIQDASGCFRLVCASIVAPSVYVYGRKNTCGNCADLGAATAVITQKRIQRTVRTDASAYATSLVPQHVYDPALLLAATTGTDIPRPWNQASDRAVAGIVVRNVPSRGSSAHCTRTSARPGACSAPGRGVDIKHGSYDRYLAKLKGRTVARPCAPQPLPVPVRANKTQYYSVAGSFHSSCGGGVVG